MARWIWRSEPAADPGDLLGRLPSPESVVWVRGGDGFVGWGEAVRIEVPEGRGAFARAEQALRDLFAASEIHDEVNVPGSGPVAFGSFAFDSEHGSSVLIVPRVILARRAGVSWLTTLEGEAEPRTGPSRYSPIAPISWSATTAEHARWTTKVRTALAEIRSGHMSKVVLSRHLNGLSAGIIDPRSMIEALGRRFTECFTFSCGGLMGATPEPLIRKEGGRVESLVLAGSVPRGADEVTDLALRATLHSSAKLAHEHRLSVESVEEKLAALCTEVSVPPPMSLVLANIQHLATLISGRLRADDSALSLAAALHPTAAVCGTPSAVALRFIREFESARRARYAGPVGWMDSRGDGEWGLALRCASVIGRRVKLWAGAGIVEGSEPQAEWMETEVKLSGVLDALSAVQDLPHPAILTPGQGGLTHT